MRYFSIFGRDFDQSFFIDACTRRGSGASEGTHSSQKRAMVDFREKERKKQRRKVSLPSCATVTFFGTAKQPLSDLAIARKHNTATRSTGCNLLSLF